MRIYFREWLKAFLVGALFSVLGFVFVWFSTWIHIPGLNWIGVVLLWPVWLLMEPNGYDPGIILIILANGFGWMVVIGPFLVFRQARREKNSPFPQKSSR